MPEIRDIRSYINMEGAKTTFFTFLTISQFNGNFSGLYLWNET